MDWLQIVANIAQIVGVIVVLVSSGNATFKALRDFFKKRQPIRMPSASTIRNILLGLILLAVVSLRFSPIFNTASNRPASSTPSLTPTPIATPTNTPTPTPTPSGITAAHKTNGTDSDGNATATTATVTPTANKLYLLLVENARSGGVNPQTPSVTGCNLTWVQVNTVIYDPTGSSRRRLTLFRAMGTSPNTGSLSITFNGENQAQETWSLDEFSHVDTTGTNGSSAVVQSANNFVNTNVALTVTLSAFSSTQNATYGGFANWGGDPLNTGSGFTQLGKDTTNDTVLTEFKNINVTTVDADGGAASQQIGGIAVEIKSQ